MKISAEITPSQLSNLLFDKFQNLNQIISNEVLDEKEKMSEKNSLCCFSMFHKTLPRNIIILPRC